MYANRIPISSNRIDPNLAQSIGNCLSEYVLDPFFGKYILNKDCQLLVNLAGQEPKNFDRDFARSYLAIKT